MEKDIKNHCEHTLINHSNKKCLDTEFFRLCFFILELSIDIYRVNPRIQSK